MRVKPGRSVGNLPADLTSFIGRRRELKEAKRLLSGTRLLTLTGTGGVGKTRLAWRIAAEVRRVFTDGVWLVELAGLLDPHLLPNTVASALGLRATADPAAGLAEFLEDRHLLLVLDNCEHMVDECAVLVAKLLAAGSQVRVIATSRQVLRAEGEHILHIEPMPVPHGVAEDPDRETRQSDAVTLFVERAAAVQPDFGLAPDNLAVVRQICERLEGIPLALELAAVRLRVLSVDQLLHRLDRRFALLTSGPRGARPQQQTLEATIDWSFGLCSPEEQLMWTRMSVFPGGFDLDAADHVHGPVENGGASVFDIVAGLVDKSVVIRQNGTYGWHGWYRMLETVREYGEAKLTETGGERQVRARQVGYYVELARRYRAEEFGPRQLEWLTRLRHEHANLRAVLEYCLSTPGQGHHALDIASSLMHFWIGGSFLFEGCRYLRRGLEHVRDATMPRAQGLHALSMLATVTGEADSARQLLAELAAFAHDLDDERLRAGHAEILGLATLYAGDVAGGAELLARAAVGFHATGDTMLLFDTLIMLASAYFFLDDPRSATTAAEALALAEQRTARWSRGYALRAVAINRWRSGEHRAAADLLREAVGLRLPDRTLLAFLLEALAWCDSSAGEHQRVARLMGCTTTVWHLSGARVGETSLHRELNERCAAQARADVGTAAFDAAFAEGAGLSLDEAILYALGEKPTKAARGPEATGEPGGLTRREREIAELVGEGMSNKAIAARLVIGRRTVETHVQHIMVKLGFTSRTQVASWLVQQKHQSP